MTTLTFIAAMLLAGTALAHRPAAPRGHLTIAARVAFLTGAVKHHRYVCRHGAGHARWWHCKALQWTRRELDEAQADRAALQRRSPLTAIRFIFGEDWHAAVAVARCESHLTTTARNGQYRGLFQMGKRERELYGHGTSALAQARAAHRYFIASGRDWSPWQCKPI